MALANLSALELGRLRLSVGYGTHKKGRPLSPVEVGSLLKKARSEGATLDECAVAIQLDGTGHIGRFLRILELPEDIQHLIDWGSGSGFVGFTLAVELAKLESAEDQRALAQSILSSEVNSKEVRQIVQLRRRSGHSIEACITEILGMRPKIEKRYVFVGSINPESSKALDSLSQAERDTILASGIKKIGLQNAIGRLGRKFFTLVGQEKFDASMREIGKEKIEIKIRSYIAEVIENGEPAC